MTERIGFLAEDAAQDALNRQIASRRRTRGLESRVILGRKAPETHSRPTTVFNRPQRS